VLDEPRPAGAEQRLTALLEAIEEGDAATVADVIALEAPPQLRNTPAVWAFLRQRLDQLMHHGLAEGLASLPTEVALDDRSALAAVTAPTLVIGCRGDDRHPTTVAEQLAASLPNATLHIYDRPGVVWTQRADLRERISGFLNH
jgi:pimeloyl-ACP methyl ester carboxylesterase